MALVDPYLLEHPYLLVDPYLRCRAINIAITAILGIAAILGIIPKTKGFGLTGPRVFINLVSEASRSVEGLRLIF